LIWSRRPVNSIGGFTLVLLLLLVGAPTLDTLDILDPRCKSSNHYIVIAIDSDWTSGVGSDPASEGISSTDNSLVTEESSSSDIYDVRILKHFSM
jgi:hypothetical protein